MLSKLQPAVRRALTEPARKTLRSVMESLGPAALARVHADVGVQQAQAAASVSAVRGATGEPARRSLAGLSTPSAAGAGMTGAGRAYTTATSAAGAAMFLPAGPRLASAVRAAERVASRDVVPARTLATRADEVAYWMPRILQHLYPDRFPELPTHRSTSSGRLSSTGFLTVGDKTYFAKMSRPGKLGENTAAGAYVANAGRHVGIPFLEHLTAKDGRLFGIVPDAIDGVPVPEHLCGCTVTLTPMVKNPQNLAGINKSGLPKYSALEEIGRNLGLYRRLGDLHKELSAKGLSTANPHTPDELTRVFHEVFGLKPGMSEVEIERQVERCVGNLLYYIADDNTTDPNDEQITGSFAEGLQNGFVQSVLDVLKGLEKEMKGFPTLTSLPAGIVPLDLKPANFFWDVKGGKLVITHAFDLDWSAYAPLMHGLGRSIAFNCFNEKGEFDEKAMMAVIKGYLEHAPITGHEANVLAAFIEVGAITSAVVRSTYYDETLHRRETSYVIDRLDPTIHLRQLESLREWLRKNDLSKMVMEAQQTPKISLCQQICEAERKLLEKATPGEDLSPLFALSDAVRGVVNNVTGAEQALANAEMLLGSSVRDRRRNEVNAGVIDSSARTRASMEVANQFIAEVWAVIPEMVASLRGR